MSVEWPKKKFIANIQFFNLRPHPHHILLFKRTMNSYKIVQQNSYCANRKTNSNDNFFFGYSFFYFLLLLLELLLESSEFIWIFLWLSYIWIWVVCFRPFITHVIHDQNENKKIFCCVWNVLCPWLSDIHFRLF